MTRKERVSLRLKETNDKLRQNCFNWNHGKFSYWETCEIVENMLNEQKFYFCESDGKSIFFAFEKNSSGNYEISSQDFIKKYKEFEEWLILQVDKASRTLIELENLDIDG